MVVFVSVNASEGEEEQQGRPVRKSKCTRIGDACHSVYRTFFPVPKSMAEKMAEKYGYQSPIFTDHSCHTFYDCNPGGRCKCR